MSFYTFQSTLRISERDQIRLSETAQQPIGSDVEARIIDSEGPNYRQLIGELILCSVDGNEFAGVWYVGDAPSQVERYEELLARNEVGDEEEFVIGSYTNHIVGGVKIDADRFLVSSVFNGTAPENLPNQSKAREMFFDLVSYRVHDNKFGCDDVMELVDLVKGAALPLPH